MSGNRGNYINKITMRIKELIEIFEKLLVIYKKEEENRKREHSVHDFRLNNGICSTAKYFFDKDIYDVIERHYENYLLKGGYLFNKGNLTKRIEFMEEEIPYLKNLIGKGYTHL